MNQRGPNQPIRNAARRRLQERYNGLWSTTFAVLRTGRLESDPILAAHGVDQRRGLTVIARPSANVRQRVATFLRELRSLEPDQYYYSPSEFHVTVLSLFTATIDHGPFLGSLEGYEAAVDSALRNVAPIQIDFTGITASPAAVMIQGFCDNEMLNEVRDALRFQLRSRGLVEGVDARYRLETAHMTVARFRAPLRDSERFATMLKRSRRLPFGQTLITTVNLVKNDWYMSRQSLEILKRYKLSRV
jgi:2'-5' RNA ligase